MGGDEGMDSYKTFRQRTFEYVTRVVPGVKPSQSQRARVSESFKLPLYFLKMPVALSYYNDTHKPSSSKAPTETVGSVKRTSFSFDPMEEALASFTAGEFLVVTDDENRENEGDLIISASQCTTEKMAWLIKHSRQVPSLLI